MKIIQDRKISFDRPIAASIGKFEGLHLGHQGLIQLARQYADRFLLPLVVFSFSPHPKRILSGDDYRPLFTDAEKVFLFEELGVDIVKLFTFDRSFANIEPEEFARAIFENCQCRALVVGENFYFGKNRTGDINLLKREGAAYGADVAVLPSRRDGGKRISTSGIREAITANDFYTARRWMGRPFFLRGVIVHGEELGRTIGFPTINIIPGAQKFLPSNGVYITTTRYNNIDYGSITNIGINPTVNGKKKTVETYLLDFNGWIYGETAQVFFLARLRGEERFESLDMLKRQLHLDEQAARAFHNNNRRQREEWHG
jgi:riboflavin kinase/FMN adenylyltransferase